MNGAQFAEFIDKLDPQPTGCWEWQGGHHSGGYSTMNRHSYVHRLSYEHFVGPIPEGLQIDHLCRNRGCVNPDHLEPVTPRENSLRGESLNAQRARQTHCINGHPLDDTNTYVRKEGWRVCKECTRQRAGEIKRQGRARKALAQGTAAYEAFLRMSLSRQKKAVDRSCICPPSIQQLEPDGVTCYRCLGRIQWQAPFRPEQRPGA